jgi:hypothetical protein
MTEHVPAAAEGLPDPFQSGPFRHVKDMEEPLTTATDLARGIAILAEKMDDGLGSSVQRMAWMIMDEVEKAEGLRCTLWDITHPNPARIAQRYEKEATQ